MALQNVSQSVYKGLCVKIGTREQVCYRRDTVDIAELLVKENFVSLMDTGSCREGFRLNGSDEDKLMWVKDIRVIWNRSQWLVDNFNYYTIVLCDCSETPPGYVLLQIQLSHLNHPSLLSACEKYKDVQLISSSKFRMFIGSALYHLNSTMHGPCLLSEEHGMEYDVAFGLSSDHWPPAALGWIDRCQSWPPSAVVADIVRSGCHFVAIGKKEGNHTNDEWRISFTKAERKLVYLMNHTQFLTYGLLKLFLKEIINKDLSEEETVLSSYHMKTAVFWVIQQNTVPCWNPQNLLTGFWVCFKLLLKWVYEGVCPNFFIRENNMFIHKMHHGAQYTLFNKLYDLYEKGIMVVLECPSIGSYMMDNLYSLVFNPNLSLRTNHMLISEAAFDEGLFGEILKNDVLGHPEDKLRPTEYIKKVEKLLRVHLSKYQVLMLQRLTVSALHTTVFYLKSQCTDTLSGNRKMYIFDKLYCNMLKIAAKFGVISDMLFIAMHFYATCRYTKAISVLSATKVKLRKPGLIYYRNWDPESYTEAVGGQSWSTKMREAVASDVVLYSHIFYIPELTLEQEYSYKLKRETLCIPPFILLHMLEFLCYQHVDANKAFTALIDLQDVVFKDDRIPYFLKDISWNIFGTCEQIYGNQFAALFCYIQSCLEVKQNRIHLASVKRMIDMRLYCH